MTVTEIAERTGVAQSLVARVVAQLHDGGVVETATDETDRPCTRSAIRFLGTRARSLAIICTSRYVKVQFVRVCSRYLVRLRGTPAVGGDH